MSVISPRGSHTTIRDICSRFRKLLPVSLLDEIFLRNKKERSLHTLTLYPLALHLNESPHLPALLPVPRGVVEDDVRGPDPLPGQAGVGDVVVVGRVPHQEDVVPLGDDLAVGGQGLGPLILNIISPHILTSKFPQLTFKQKMNDVISLNNFTEIFLISPYRNVNDLCFREYFSIFPNLHF